MKQAIYLIIFILCSFTLSAQNNVEPFLLVLGTAQDGGYPHAACTKICCSKAWNDPAQRRYVVSLALADPASGKWWLFEATPDIKEQLQYFRALTDAQYKYLPDGIFITHAHIGHYTGLMQLGREVISSKEVPVYVLPKMKSFLESNGPWQQLVSLKNIVINTLEPNTPIVLTDNINIRTFTVPHRDEYSETAGFKINTLAKKYLFIPDINKWSQWEKDIRDEVKTADIALLDATFYDTTELPGKRLSTVPHPFVTETIELFNDADKTTKSKIHFIHFNHTNPLIWDDKKQNDFLKTGFNMAAQGQKL